MKLQLFLSDRGATPTVAREVETDLHMDAIVGRLSQSAEPFDAWHEDEGPVLWWDFPVAEEPYVGTPLDEDWPFEDTGTIGWTRLFCPARLA